MKIIIYPPINPAHGYQVFSESKRITNINANMFPCLEEFDESELLIILGEKAFEKFENGESVFEVPAWKIRIAEGY